MKRNIITEEMFAQMNNDYKRNYSIEEIAQKYGFKTNTVKLHFNKHGIYFTKSKYFTKKELESIVLDYNNGMKVLELSKKYNRDSGTLIGKLKSIGVYKYSNHHFTKEEIEMLKIYYPKGDWDKIVKLLPEVSKQSIYTKMSKLGISMTDCHWSSDDIDLLYKNYENSYGNIANLIDLFGGKYTYSAITSKAEKLGLKTKNFWSEQEIEILTKNYSIKTVDEILALFPNRTRHNIIAKAIDLGLKNYCKYQGWEVQFIIDNWKTMSDEEMAKKLSKSISGLGNKRLSLGLSRRKEKSCYNDIYDFLRKNNSFWKKDSMSKCNYKCILTQKRFDDIHHLHSFNKIVSETIDFLNIDTSKCMDDFSKEELKEILFTFRYVQNKYPLGVCLKKEIHSLFHNIYGYGNTTENDWNEFLIDFKNGVYSNILKIA